MDLDLESSQAEQQVQAQARGLSTLINFRRFLASHCGLDIISLVYLQSTQAGGTNLSLCVICTNFPVLSCICVAHTKCFAQHNDRQAKVAQSRASKKARVDELTAGGQGGHAVHVQNQLDKFELKQKMWDQLSVAPVTVCNTQPLCIACPACPERKRVCMSLLFLSYLD
jgi:hypothetical protein